MSVLQDLKTEFCLHSITSKMFHYVIVKWVCMQVSIAEQSSRTSCI